MTILAAIRGWDADKWVARLQATLPGRDIVVGVRGQPRVEHRLDGGVSDEEFGYESSVFAVLTHPQHQGLEPAHGQVGVERARHRAGAVLQERKRRVEFLVVGQQGATHHVGVPADVLGGGMQHDVRAEQQRLLQRR